MRRRPKNLSSRHNQVIDLVVQGRTNDEIGSLLSLAEKTVRNHVSDILAILANKTKTPMRNRQDIVRWALTERST